MTSTRQQHPFSNSASQSHVSRRDYQSTQSMRSPRSGNPVVESAVTRLLVSIKELLEALSLWSTLKVNESLVSDVYVRLGNGFNEAVAAFAAFNIDMSELLSVPDDLRAVLEQCLAEDATPEILEIYLPRVRQIITHLLQGLRGKQDIYRQILSDARRSESGHVRDGSRSSNLGEGSRREGRGSRSHRSQLSRIVAEQERYGETGNANRRSAQSTSSRRKEAHIQSYASSTASTADTEETLVASSVAPNERTSSPPSTRAERTSQSRRGPTSPRRNVPSTDQGYFPDPRLDPPAEDAPQQQPRSANFVPEEDSIPPPTPSHPQVPASVKRYSLVDRPVSSSSPVFIVDEPSTPVSNPDRSEAGGSSPPDSPSHDILPPAMVNSLAALKKSETLERRASKRFSTYNISKMTGGSTARERSLRGHQPNRRSLAAGNAPLTPGDLAVLTEAEEEESPPPTIRTSLRPTKSRSDAPHLEEEESAPVIPPLPSSTRTTPEPTAVPTRDTNGNVPPTISGSRRLDDTEGSVDSQTSFDVFLQLGREVKKVRIEPGMTFSSLRVLFVDKFSYNPGMEKFPAIYIRDPSSGVQYELEDMDEVKEKCLLSLNIEPLDQIKQHIDTQMLVLSQDIKELRSAVTSNRTFPQMPAIIGQPLSESTPAPNRPTDRQLQHVAHRLSRIVGDSHLTSSTLHPQMTGTTLQPQMTGQSLQSQMTGGSVWSEYTTRVVGDLRTQFDEVQNLRRDLGIMKQLYSEFSKSTKDSLGVLRKQTHAVKQIASTSVSGARGYIESGKAQLDSRTQNMLTRVEELQDTVEGVKDDVLKRNVSPKPAMLKSVKDDINSIAAELKSLKEHLQTVAPMWKKTWEEELQTLIEEQQFLGHQEEFVNDLLEDHKAVVEIFGHVEKVINLRGSGSRKHGVRYKPPPMDEGHSGLSTVMLEIRSASVDPEKRLKAIAANQKSREKELASKADEFQAELSGFIGGKKLRMTGGAEEAERVRQKRSDMALKAMFTGNSLSFSADAPQPQPSQTTPSE